MRRAWQIGAVAAGVGAVVVGLALALPGDDTERPAPRASEPFSSDSPWNRPASSYGTPERIPRSWRGDFNGENGEPLGIERSWEHGKAIFQARRSDPTATYRVAPASQCFDDPSGCASFQPEDPDHVVRPQGSASPDRIPIPRDVRCPGLPDLDDDHDRALVVLSADRSTAWEFWHCTHAATRSEPWYTAAVATRWNLDSKGFQDEELTGNGSPSARASGTPLVITTITPSEALRGIHHAIGLTVNEVDDRWVNPPASHSDGCRGCSHLRYGMLFVLNRGFEVPADATPLERNVAAALKRYGAYIVDRGPLFELDGSPNEPIRPSASAGLWRLAGGGDLGGLGIEPGDLRFVPRD
jgi:hypothetical protein